MFLEAAETARNWPTARENVLGRTVKCRDAGVIIALLNFLHAASKRDEL